ncbi:2-phosphosulfolactate phosphatase [Nonomuraea lactucae]|uniref:2-phosphosulfolactate phosphatase n=1 Tax=Nonomuraea lactucae TaxID=2249762 RepID=UPI0013B3A740|nr:2-phosphosulfolactate phosphatase [Nonomuraea lactucae]
MSRAESPGSAGPSRPDDLPAEPDVLAPTGFDAWPGCDVHVEWGVTGAALAAARGDAIVVVDVLSFSTTLAIAVARGFTCLVYSGAEIAEMGGPEAAARRLAARPLSKQRRVPPGELSLSPGSLLRADPDQRVLFTSLNGASVAAASASAPALLVSGLRNAAASARTARALLTSGAARRITVVACGEQWNSVEPGVSGLRPAVEDWQGAGLLCRRLGEAGLSLSAEAALAAGAWESPDALLDCVSARELVAAGFAEDVELGMKVDVSDVVAVRDNTEPSGRAFMGRRSPG